jgi:hypothetical protein
MRELKHKLGRHPTGEEFVDYIRNADLSRLDRWRNGYVANGYQERADKINSRYSQYLRKAEAEAEKFDFPEYIGLWNKSEVDKYKKQPWYDPEIFMRLDGGNPLDKTFDGRPGSPSAVFPKNMWIKGRIKQLREQDRKPMLESYRRALMNVAKNNVRPGGLYQNTQNTRRGMIV